MLKFVGCTDSDLSEPRNIAEVSSLREAPYENPCWKPTPDCRNLKTVTNEVISLPGYCDIAVSYRLWDCQGVITLEDLTYHFVAGTSCNDWLASVQTSCYNSCTFNDTQPPMDPNCIQDCISDAILQVNQDAHWYILEEYLRENNYVSCDDPFGNPPIATRFFMEQCKLVCHSSPYEYYSPQDIEIYVCGGGCCEQGAKICFDNAGNAVRQDPYSNSNGINCSTVSQICEQLYNEHTVSDCKPATCSN